MKERNGINFFKKKAYIRNLKNKGFTLIELIVVIAVLGILVLLAAPKFLGYTQDAKLAQIQSDLKAQESQIIAELAVNPSAEYDFEILSQEEMSKINDSNKALNKKGKIVNNLGGKNYILNDELNSKLKGKFIWTSDDKVIYYDENLTEDFLEKIGAKDGSKIEQNDTDEEEEPDVPLEYTPENQFSWVEDKYANQAYKIDGQVNSGYFKYTGTDETVVIPHTINGNKLTSYYGMFKQSNSNVKKVVSDNPNITSTVGMFQLSNSTELDLTKLDTSNVTKMNDMFSNAKATNIKFGGKFNTSKVQSMSNMFYNSYASTLDLSKFNTSSVTNMNSMFKLSKATTITFGNDFNTSNVTDMSYMFSDSMATSVDVSKFDTSKVTTMEFMFNNLKADVIDVSKFKTPLVTNISSMFKGTVVKSLDLRHFNTSNVSYASNVFEDSEATNINVSGWNVSKVFNARNMFANAKVTSLDLSSFNTPALIYMDSMFLNSKILKFKKLT